MVVHTHVNFGQTKELIVGMQVVKVHVSHHAQLHVLRHVLVDALIILEKVIYPEMCMIIKVVSEEVVQVDAH
jgi:hypothetical protein